MGWRLHPISDPTDCWWRAGAVFWSKKACLFIRKQELAFHSWQDHFILRKNIEFFRRQWQQSSDADLFGRH